MSNSTGAFFVHPPQPKTRLGRHRQLSPLADIHVSLLCLGAMNIGDKWEKIGFGTMDKASSFKLLDAFYEAGGNFIDTANIYQDESSEEFIGEWMEQRGVRDQMVIATKYTSDYKRGSSIPQQTHYVGNNLKSLHMSTAASLKKLRTNYIDIFYVHWWDWSCGVKEVMDGLHNFVPQGKVLYLGISDTPAWIVSKANMYARMANKTPFVVYQGAWSILQRDFERDIIPMAREEGMALAPFRVIGAGKIRADAEEERRRQWGEKGRTWATPERERTADERKVCLALEKVAEEVGAKSITAVALAYVMQKTPYVFPIVGGRKVEHLMDNVAALEIALSEEQVKYLEDVLPFVRGFPHDMIGDGSSYYYLHAMGGHFDRWPRAQAIRPTTEQT